ncbi:MULTISPECIES: hypothetical protein [unclassified Rathayibacter]|uniref:DUF6993 domain-containing protein n=1 Tax=unclassified Rathayibacter TaxID=2609250 RepID=UPI0010D5DFE2|nr:MULTISPECIES: hypothetical protein [unclassified Rathayibacter]TCL84470.1 hypothetical protein EDF49_102138 [Rathayibacter sp. PhB192]TCM30188.1 hypothetical protein EDF43_102138 [Rathayibacter sp. PhB179]
MVIREPTPSPSRSGARAVTVLAVVTAVLSGCALGLPPIDGSAPPSPAPSAVPSVDGPGQAVPLDLEAFDAINSASVASISDPSGADLTRALIAGGVDRAGLEVTADITTADKRADAVFVAVRVGGSCLVGQYRHKASGEDGDPRYLGAVVAPLSTGRCLIGDLVPVE